ncbi:MAG TPA: carbohydrate ABC transporter permease [Clostridiales bacterium]|nr:carbohydrate ABC transporter permease [Clostridiales bacterium]HBK25404.1 carbohydrate ABC transporter permease [Clostridiales bacterium]HCP70491.1 carbohydrate ABC transporter permease [Clostridiales bacterium]
MRSKRTGKILSRIFIVLCLIVALFPIYWMLCTSFKSEGEIYRKIPTMIPKQFTLEAYSYLLTKTNFLNAIKNSLLVAVVVSLLSILIAYPTAYTLARTKFRGRRILSKTVLFTYMLPTSVLYIPLYILVARLGLTNTLWGLILIYPTFTLPYVAWILIPHVASIPVALEEAARMDGCSQLKIMYKIVFPLALPGIVSTTIFAFAMCWGEYLYALVNLTSSTVQTFPLVISGLIYGDMPPWNQLMAGAIMACVPIVIIYMVASSSLVGGATAGGVKQ